MQRIRRALRRALVPALALVLAFFFGAIVIVLTDFEHRRQIGTADRGDPVVTSTARDRSDKRLSDRPLEPEGDAMEATTSRRQGDLGLLDEDVARELLGSRCLARLAYNWRDGTPRVVPIWFHWNGSQFVVSSPPRAPKLKALASGSKVAITIDSESWPYHVLMIRGTADVKMVDGVPAEYTAAARRYMGIEQGDAWSGQVAARFAQMARIAITPEWVGVIDFENRFPSALA